ILAAAEELFAQHGFAGTSLRQVTSQAAVNIAAVNYHFGSKENLINEVFRRRMDVMTADRLQQLEAALRDHPGQLEPILAAFIDPALALAQDRNGGAAFVRLIARAYAEHNESLRRFLSDHYGHVLREFGKALSGLLPGLDKEALCRRPDLCDVRFRPDQAPGQRQRGRPSQPGRPGTHPLCRRRIAGGDQVIIHLSRGCKICPRNCLYVAPRCLVPASWVRRSPPTSPMPAWTPCCSTCPPRRARPTASS